jgi:hypothetical protein
VDARQASADTSAGVKERGTCTAGHTGTCEGSMPLEAKGRRRTKRDTNEPGFPLPRRERGGVSRIRGDTKQGQTYQYRGYREKPAGKGNEQS